jgi:hypothetical protein
MAEKIMKRFSAKGREARTRCCDKTEIRILSFSAKKKQKQFSIGNLFGEEKHFRRRPGLPDGIF